MQEKNRVMNISSMTEFTSLSSPNEIQHHHSEWHLPLPFVIDIVIYISVLGAVFIFVVLIIKYLGKFGDDELTRGRDQIGRETEHLIEKKEFLFKYGTYNKEEEEDIESGKCIRSSSHRLNDGKICIICYDEQRDCFFVPCGHCATCHTCADRIVNGESKRCPVCRRLIRKVKKLFLQKKLTWMVEDRSVNISSIDR